MTEEKKKSIRSQCFFIAVVCFVGGILIVPQILIGTAIATLILIATYFSE